MPTTRPVVTVTRSMRETAVKRICRARIARCCTVKPLRKKVPAKAKVIARSCGSPKNQTIAGATATRSNEAEVPITTLIQKRFDTWACVISARCTVGIERPTSLNTRMKPITLVTMATRPKSFGTSNLVKAITDRVLSANPAPCAVTDTAVLDRARFFRSPRRCRVSRCASFEAERVTRPVSTALIALSSSEQSVLEFFVLLDGSVLLAFFIRLRREDGIRYRQDRDRSAP